MEWIVLWTLLLLLLVPEGVVWVVIKELVARLVVRWELPLLKLNRLEDDVDFEEEEKESLPMLSYAHTRTVVRKEREGSWITRCNVM